MLNLMVGVTHLIFSHVSCLEKYLARFCHKHNAICKIWGSIWYRCTKVMATVNSMNSVTLGHKHSHIALYSTVT